MIHQVNTAGSHAGADFFCDTLRQLQVDWDAKPAIILNAGCGEGHEAVAIQQQLGGCVEAVDVEDQVLPQFRDLEDVRFQISSVCELPFADAHFDAVFYHHVIEHVDDAEGSLREIARVLKPGGWLFVGTPNRNRLLSSLGAHKQTHWQPTWQKKLSDNWHDWKARLSGRFHNKYGAHAGFTQSELTGMLSADYQDLNWRTYDYLQFKYQSHRLAAMLPLARQPVLSEIIPPSIYVFARRR